MVSGGGGIVDTFCWAWIHNGRSSSRWNPDLLGRHVARYAGAFVKSSDTRARKLRRWLELTTANLQIQTFFCIQKTTLSSNSNLVSTLTDKLKSITDHPVIYALQGLSNFLTEIIEAAGSIKYSDMIIQRHGLNLLTMLSLVMRRALDGSTPPCNLPFAGRVISLLSSTTIDGTYRLGTLSCSCKIGVLTLFLCIGTLSLHREIVSS